METGDASLEADLKASLLNNDILALVLFISVIKLRDLLKNPESLSVELLLQVVLQNVSELEFLTDCSESQKITE